jgi:hypothetical protein
VHGRGDITLKQHNIKLRDVLYVPQLTKTLIATKSLTNQGLRIHIDDNLQVYKEKHHLFTAKEHNNLYFLPKESVTSYQANETITLEQAHKRFGHASTERLTKLQDATRDIKISTNTRHFCDICAQSKSVRQPFPKERETKPTRRYEIISSDLKGPLQIEGSQGHRYFITFNCLYSKWTWVTFLKQKTADAVLEATKLFITDAQAETHQRMTTLLTDNGSEYVNEQMSEYLLCKNIKHMRTVAHSPQQNGTAERKNRTIMEMARSAMIQAQVPYELWPHAVNYAVHTLNRLPTKSIHWKTPYELWIGKQPNVSYLRPFGCKHLLTSSTSSHSIPHHYPALF